MHEQNPSQTPPPLRPRRRKLPWILGAIAVVAVLLVVGLLALSRVIDEKWGDFPEPPDVTGFERYTPAVADEDNAYIFYLRAANATVLDDCYFDRYYEETYEDALTSTLLDDLRKEYSKPLQLYNRALAAPETLAPREVTLENYPIPDGVHTRDFDNLMFLYLNQRFYQGEEKAALEDCLDYTYLGHRIMQAQGPYAVYQEGVYLTETGLGVFAHLVMQSDLSNDELRVLAARLGTLRDDGRALRQSLVETYHAILATIRAAIEPDFDEVFGENSSLSRFLEAQNTTTAYNWQPNRTRALLLNVLRPLADAARGSYAEMPRERIPTWQEPAPSDALDIVKPNGFGRFMCRFYLSDLEYTLQTKPAHNTYVALAQTAAAMKMYHNDHEGLPPTLDALAPDYMAAVPVDDFAGAPLRYNKKRAVVYSIGADLRDAGGKLGEDAKDDIDEIVLDLSLFLSDRVTDNENAATNPA